MTRSPAPPSPTPAWASRLPADAAGEEALRLHDAACWRPRPTGRWRPRWWAGQVTLPLRAPRTPDERMPKAVKASPLANVGGRHRARIGLLGAGPGRRGAEAALAGAGGRARAAAGDAGAGHRRRPPDLCSPGIRRFPIRKLGRQDRPDIDVRGDGGYIVLPPSSIRATERRHPARPDYTWAPGRSPRTCRSRRARLAGAAGDAGGARAGGRFGEARAGRGRAGEPVRRGGAGHGLPDGRHRAGRQAAGHLWGYACQIGGFVAGGEIDARPMRSRAAGRRRAHGPRSGQALGERTTPRRARPSSRRQHPRTAPELRGFQPAGGGRRRPAAKATRPAEAAVDIRDARALWDADARRTAALVAAGSGRGLDAGRCRARSAGCGPRPRAPLQG
jgi:hypothetical protein